MIAAGWFETRRRGTQRWWNGSAWTPNIRVRGQETTLDAHRIAVRRQLILTEIVLVILIVAAIVVAIVAWLPVVVIRPLIVGAGVALIIAPLLVRRQVRRMSMPARRFGTPSAR